MDRYSTVLDELGVSINEAIEYELNGFIANLDGNTRSSPHLMGMKKRLFRARLINLFEHELNKKGVQ